MFDWYLRHLEVVNLLINCGRVTVVFLGSIFTLAAFSRFLPKSPKTESTYEGTIEHLCKAAAFDAIKLK
ncbi:hypothetical protein DPMN_180128 [Dreissena polymorpha]|uniref:Uncharacterized protein n=1 Tax=Dreissena polymorpha TaxID=45954 RepID=A0A9D4EFE0_DREPO|nr:hypothetical protein DPMN_180128 [Dreissena polymorpha]